MSENSADRDGPDSPTGVRPAADSARLTVDDLLASPRGRSLLYAIVGASEMDAGTDDEPVGDGDVETVGDGDVEPGDDVEVDPADVLGCAALTAAETIDREWETGILISDSGADFAELREADAAAEAVGLGRRTPHVPSQAELESAMAEVIAGAMYWQPPDPEDVIAADPVMVDVLRPWAEVIIDSGLLDSWSAGLDFDDLWELTWDDSDHTGDIPTRLSADPASLMSGADCPPPSDAAAAALREWSAEVASSESEYRQEFAKDPRAAGSGEWWSTPAHELVMTTGTWPSGEPIGLSLVEDDFGLSRARACRLRLWDTYGVFIVDRPEQWAVLCRKYPLDVTAQRRQVWFEATGRRGRWVIPDWPRVAEEYDGVYVSLAGYLRTAGAVVDVGDADRLPESAGRPTVGDTDDRIASLMAGWNPDTTYWLTDAVAGITEVVDWAQDDETGAWVAQPRPARP
ncbi:hypothetical protein [Brevibacterium metallidurans]|uniref:Uncharacterized protein n=1 Tax=Brevibacterium metallidurans TaxID=1482676 RepID=A0ABP3CBC4_9MICO